jgi:hypothetical protein
MKVIKQHFSLEIAAIKRQIDKKLDLALVFKIIENNYALSRQ